MKLRSAIAMVLILALVLCACGGKNEKIEDGNYTIDVSLTGGSGRASILSPVNLTVKDGAMTVTLVWSSSNYDYMIVDGVKYEPVTYEVGSTFCIPVKSLEDLPIIGDTVAMSTPHEVEYVLNFDAKTLAKAE